MYSLLVPAVVATLLSTSAAVTYSPPSSCAADTPATIVTSVTPDYPAIAALEHLTGTSIVSVALSESGRVLDTHVAVSSGSSVLDRAAIRTAQSMTYAPEIRECKAVSGQYAVEIQFGD